MSRKNIYDRIVDWFDVRFGFSKAPLKPIPLFTFNPIYWLGALLAVTFALQGLTGFFMLQYYVPQPDQAYSSTIYIIKSVPLGHLIETMHLYTAYAMVLLTFMHLMRNYFGSSHKEHRELMWLAGVALMLIVISFAVTGYLLPWTVISKSATDVAVGFLGFLPTGLGSLAKFLITGVGSDADQLRRFVAIHTVLLPGALLLFLGLKVYMYEVHGPSYVAAFGKLKVPGGRIVRWFPKVFLYGVVLVSAYIAILLAVSALVPLSLPPEFSSATAGQYVVQPDWYLLWLYQILKFQVFEGPGAAYALAAVTVLLLLLLVLPFYDRSSRRDLSARPVFVTIGVIAVVEFIALTIWGYLTPGQVIPDVQAVAVIGGVALAVIILTWITYRVYRGQEQTRSGSPSTAPTPATKLSTIGLAIHQCKPLLVSVGHSLCTRFTVVFVLLLAAASVALSSLVNMLSTVWLNLPLFSLSIVVLGFSTYSMSWMLRRVVIAYEGEMATH